MPIHRWQPTGYTACGLRTYLVDHNADMIARDDLFRGVTCAACKAAKTLVAYFPDPRPAPDDPVRHPPPLEPMITPIVEPIITPIVEPVTIPEPEPLTERDTT